MGTAGTRTVAIDEYLRDPAYEHCKYVDGEVQELHVRYEAALQNYRENVSVSSTNIWIGIRSAPHMWNCIAD